MTAENLTKDQLAKLRSLQTDVPVHVVPIAKSFGLEVYKNFEFPDTLSGLIKREDDDSFSCHINGNHPITRQRFTIAHELAHYLLHQEHIGNGLTDDYLYRSGLSNKMEREANRLAADILMPRHLLKTDKYKDLTIQQQADAFWVSRSTMDIRLGELL